MASAKSSWTCCPFGTFAAFQARYAKQMDLTGDGAFTLSSTWPGQVRLVTPTTAPQ